MATKTVDIGGRLVGDGQPCMIIAEVGINHNGDTAIAQRLIAASAQAVENVLPAFFPYGIGALGVGAARAQVQSHAVDGPQRRHALPQQQPESDAGHLLGVSLGLVQRDDASAFVSHCIENLPEAASILAEATRSGTRRHEEGVAHGVELRGLDGLGQVADRDDVRQALVA